MATPEELEKKFWKSLRSDMTVMLGLSGAPETLTHPMTAQLDGDRDHGPIWFFTARDTELCQAIGSGTKPAFIAYSAKGHDLFANVGGSVRVDNDRAIIDRLWSKFVAAWFEGGKDDPKLALLRFEPSGAEIWLNESSLLAGIKVLLGSDPKKDYQDKVAKVAL